MGKKITAVLIVFIALGGLAFGYYVFVRPKGGVSTEMITQTIQRNVPENVKEEAALSGESLGEPKGDSDDIAGAVADQLLTEEEKFTSEEMEAEEALIDQAVLDDFGQSYDENEF